MDQSIDSENIHSKEPLTNTDINDPENLDYEDIDEQNPVKKLSNEDLTATAAAKSASDEGEVDEADLEDGEIHDPSTSKTNDESESTSPQEQVHCRYYLQGRCHWGSSCKYIHPNNDSIDKPLTTTTTTANDISPTNNSWISPQATAPAPQFFPNPLLRAQIPTTGAESAWERGLRSAKTLREQSMRRKQQDKDFNEKKFNLTIRDALDEKDLDDNYLNINRPSSIDHDLSDYPDQHRSYSDRYYSHYKNNSNNRMNNSRTRHSDEYHHRREKSSSKRDDSSTYRRNSQQYSTGLHDEQAHNYNNRRGDDWHDPWDRTKNHGNSRRSSGGKKDRSYSSSSASSSSSSRSHSSTSSSSSRSRSRSRSRPKRRSPSVTRATSTKTTETIKNGNGNKKLPSPSSTPSKFLPGRQISSHTLKKAEKISNSKSSNSNHSKTKDSGRNSKNQTKKTRSDSTSSSSSSDSDTHRKAQRSSSSSTDSSSSDNDSRTKTTKSSDKSIQKQLSTSSANGNKHSNNKNKLDIESSKKRRDTSSSTGSTSTTKKAKLNNDSHKSSTDASNAENSDLNRKKEKQKLLKKLQEVEKQISQRSTRTSS